MSYWSPIFKTLTTQSLNPCRTIRQTALTSLQRCLLSPTLTSVPLQVQKQGTEYATVFNNVLFPLFGQLLKPEVYQTDPQGMGETRVQTASMLCRVFLQYLEKVQPEDLRHTPLQSSANGAGTGGKPKEYPPSSLISIWTRILSIMERLMTSSGGDNVEEAIPESLKNILLVMSSDGYLVPPEQNEQHKELWVETWRRLDRFLPNLFGELFPEEAAKGPPWKPKSPSHSKKPSLEKEAEAEPQTKTEDKEEKKPIEPKADDVD